MIADLHIHSKYSYDSLLSPKKILKIAKKRGLDVIAITDHETIKGGVITYNLNRDKDINVIIGAEINTEIGDIIGLSLNTEIKSRNSIEVIEEIKDQGGYVILPHPCRGHTLNEYIISLVDAIEVFNSRSSLEENQYALNLAKKYNKPFSAGSDAHFASEIGMGRIFLDQKNSLEHIGFTSLEESVFGEQSRWYLIHFSQIIKSKKMKHYSHIPKQIFNFVYQIFRKT